MIRLLHPLVSIFCPYRGQTRRLLGEHGFRIRGLVGNLNGSCHQTGPADTGVSTLEMELLDEPHRQPEATAASAAQNFCQPGLFGFAFNEYHAHHFLFVN